MRNYNIIEDGTDNNVKVSFEEIYEDAGNTLVRMYVKNNGGLLGVIDFDNPAQVEQCMWKMQNYLKCRNTFRRLTDEHPDSLPPLDSISPADDEPRNAAEPESEYI